MNILTVEIMLWYYARNEDFPNLDAPAVKESIEMLCSKGILYTLVQNPTSKKSFGCSQDALDVYVNAILKVPLPKQKWVVEEPMPF